MLKDLNLDPGFNMEELVRRTDGLSGSDLKESCRNAAMVSIRKSSPFSNSSSDKVLALQVPVREYMRTKVALDGGIDFSKVKDNVRALEVYRSCQKFADRFGGVAQKFDIRPLRVTDFFMSDYATPGTVESEGLD